MATLTKYANAHTAITTGYTNPTNAYATGDSAYATAAPGKNTTVSAYFGFPAFSTSDIPDTATLTSVTAEIAFKTSTKSSIATQYLQLFITTNGVGSEQSDATEPATDTALTHAVTSGITLANLRNADEVRARLRSVQGNDATAVTFSIEYVRLKVIYNWAQTAADTVTATDATTKTVTKGTVAETVTATDATTKAFTKGAIAETVTATDNITTQLILNAPTIEETVTASDATTKTLSKGTVAETVTATDASTMTVTKALEDTVTASDEMTYDLTLAPTWSGSFYGLAFSFDGSPFLQVGAASSVNTNTLEYSFDGSPFWAWSPSASTGYPIKRYTGSTWETCIIQYYNSGFSTKPISVYKDGEWVTVVNS